LELADVCATSMADRVAIAEWRDRGRRGLAERWDAAAGLCLDFDQRARAAAPVRTIAGFAPLIAGGTPDERRAALATTLAGPSFAGHPAFRWPVPPSTSPDDPAFRPRSYWRGPTWPVITWLLWWSLRRDGLDEIAARLRTASLDQLATVGFAEYCEPFTGEPLGSADQSWTAAAAIDWLATG
jgi:hypothetical protein